VLFKHVLFKAKDGRGARIPTTLPSLFVAGVGTVYADA
jgi:hypothetical protein